MPLGAIEKTNSPRETQSNENHGEAKGERETGPERQEPRTKAAAGSDALKQLF